VSKPDNLTAESRYELAKVALGEAEADLAIINGDIVNVYTGEVLAGNTILIKGSRIAYSGKQFDKGIGPHTRTIDASGKTLIPGFIDGHTHLDYLFSSSELTRFAMKTGTTSIISEVSEMGFKLGYRGILEFLKSIRDQPVKFWITFPPVVSTSPIASMHTITLGEVRRLLRKKEVLGLGELFWGPIIHGDKRLLQTAAEALNEDKKVEGHTAGASANKLQAYVSLGFTSDHEPITANETLERMRLGMSVMVREGEIREDLEAISQIKDKPIDFRKLCISSDGLGPWQFVRQGYMDHIVQKAIILGFPPVRAIQMATLNVAEYFNLDNIIGGIAPGRYADIVIIPDLTVIKPEVVISNGQVVAQDGEVVAPPRRHKYGAFTLSAIRLETKMKAEDFAVPQAGTPRTKYGAGSVSPGRLRPAVKVRVIDLVSNLLTKEAVLDLGVIKGQVQMDPAAGIIKIATVEHRHSPGKTFTGFIHGLGLREGAIAVSTGWNINDIIVAGANEPDMALAVNRIQELKGGIVICLNRKVLEELALPIGGIISLEPMEVLADKLTDIQQTALKMGCTSPDIRTTLSALTSGAIPFLRICESGLYDVKLNKIVDLIVDD
jgi:adenine deaminase